MEKFCISRPLLSHTYAMEQKTVKNEISTKEKELQKSVVLSYKDAEEYRSYKRRKKLSEITSAISASGASLFTGQEVQKVCERAIRFKQASVRLPITKLTQASYYLTGSKVKIDCVIGGAAAKGLEFERAAKLRDRLLELRGEAPMQDDTQQKRHRRRERTRKSGY